MEFIKKPPLWLCVIVWLATVSAFGGTIVLAFVLEEEEWWALLTYAASLLLVLLSVYLILTRTKVPKIMANSERVRRFIADYGYRSYVMCIGSAVFNTAYGVLGTVIAVVSDNEWLAALVWYHVALAIVRYVVFFISKKKEGTPENVRYRNRAYTVCGLALALVAFAIVPIIVLSTRGENTYNFIGGMLIYSIVVAAYSFTKLGVSIFSMRKASRSGDSALRAMKRISFANALISLYTLQAVMLKVFDDAELALKLNPIIGGLIVAAIFGMGIYMFVKGLIMRKKPFAASETPEPSEEESVDIIDMI